MCKIVLSEDGVFPIIKNEKGVLFNNIPETGFAMAGTIQGEGKLEGVPSLFIRLAGCNLKCEWELFDGSKSCCDTEYSSFNISLARSVYVKDVLLLIKNNIGNIRHIVITGGEPFLQVKPLLNLCKGIKSLGDIHITIETNGTIFDDEVVEYVDLLSISPKLPYSLRGECLEGLKGSIQNFIDFINSDKSKDIQFKFVVCNECNEKEIQHFLKSIRGWNLNDILLMPAGGSKEILAKTSDIALEMVIRNGWRFCYRLHVALFGGKKGV